MNNWFKYVYDKLLDLSIRNFLLITLNRAILIHAICWVFFITYELIILKLTTGKLDHFYIYLIYYSLNIALFYNIVVLLNFTFNQLSPRLLLGLVGFLFIILFFLSLKYFTGIILIYFKLLPRYTHHSITEIIVGNIFRFGYFTVLAIFYWAAGHISYFRKQVLLREQQQLILKNEMEHKLALSRNAYLQQQINPHMLFNALNFIYNSVYNCSAEGARAVELLADIMRFSLNETSVDGKIFVDDEIMQIRNLVEMNSYRFNYTLSLDIKIDDDFKGLKIVPLILLTLSENLFKHANLSDRKAKAILSIKLEGESLHFHTWNLKKADSGTERLKGIGLENVKIRLDHSYQNNYVLLIADEKQYFELSLKISL